MSHNFFYLKWFQTILQRLFQTIYTWGASKEKIRISQRILQLKKLIINMMRILNQQMFNS